MLFLLFHLSDKRERTMKSCATEINFLSNFASAQTFSLSEHFKLNYIIKIAEKCKKKRFTYIEGATTRL